MSLKRIIKESKTFNDQNPDQFHGGPIGDDIYKWEVYLIGPKKTSYEGGKFKLLVEIPKKYPFIPP